MVNRVVCCLLDIEGKKNVFVRSRGEIDEGRLTVELKILLYL